MCGIAGKLTFAAAPGDRDLLKKMCATLVHRGPDDEGLYVGPHIALGQRRLSIIDLDRRAVAPLSNEDGTVWVTFNGEIYNYRELRAELTKRGHLFKTNGDTEVLVHLYEEHGTDCLQYLAGMFAFAIWDARRRMLFAARDRLGKKPLVYARTPNALIFGSEIKAVTADPSVEVQPDYSAIDSYLTLQYVPSPRTAFAGINKLPPAHFLTCSATGELEIERYWRVPRGEQSKADARELESELVTRLRQAVKARMVADVPVGAFLSGGIDSSAVVAMMAQESSRPVRTFSIGFGDTVHDELPYARTIAERFGTEHHEFIVRPNAAEILPMLVRHYNEPFADSSAVPSYYVSKITREHVTVALSGDGGDENFGGYENYRILQRWAERSSPFWRLSGMVGRPLAAAADRLPYQNNLARASRAVTMLTAPLPERFRLQTSIFKPREKEAAYTSAFKALSQTESILSPLEDSPSDDFVGWMMRHDQTHYLPDCLMVKVDVASMANSLEVRAPLLDHRLVEFAATIPTHLKLNGGAGKMILRRAMADVLPPAVLEKRKTGFSLPVRKWLAGPLNDLVREMLLGDRAVRRGLFRPSFVRHMVETHTSGQRDWSQRLWALLCLELWFREFID